MNLANTTPSTNVLDCVPYVAPAWADVLSSVSIIFFCFTVIFGVCFYALDYLLYKTDDECADEYSDYP
jgi:Na+/alanine symporter